MPSRTLTPPLPGPRLIAVPGAWPPYDCETHGAACPAVRDTGPPAGGKSPGAATPRAGVGRDDDVPDRGRDDDVPDRGRADDVPDRGRAEAPAAVAAVTAAWHRQFAQVIVEILAGSRPPRQVARWTTEGVRARIGDLTRVLAPDQRPRIRRIMTSRPSASVVEMTAVVSFGPRSRALVMRFEHMPARPAAPGLPPRPSRWLCTELEAL